MSTHLHSAVAISQTRAVWSPETVTALEPVGERYAALTPALCTRAASLSPQLCSMQVHSMFTMSHTATVLSNRTMTARRQSALAAKDFTRYPAWSAEKAGKRAQVLPLRQEQAM